MSGSGAVAVNVSSVVVRSMDVDDDLDGWYEPPATPEVVPPRRKVKRLYGPDGKVLLSVSNRPPTGFHQGQRGKPRN